VRVYGGDIYGGTGLYAYGADNYSGNLVIDGANVYGDGGAGTNFSFGVRTGGHSAAETTRVTNATIDGGSGANYAYGVFMYATDGDPVALVNNVIRGGVSDDTYGVYTDFTAAVGSPIPVVNNLIDGGTGTTTSTGVFMSETHDNLALVNNIIDGGTGTTSYGLRAINVSALLNNDIYGASVDCLVYANNSSSCLTDIADVNLCGWSGCGSASDNKSVNPLFDGDGMHLTGPSECIGAGTDPSAYYADPIVDIDGQARPINDWDIGVDEVP
jgi:hypothetical protein